MLQKVTIPHPLSMQRWGVENKRTGSRQLLITTFHPLEKSRSEAFFADFEKPPMTSWIQPAKPCGYAGCPVGGTLYFAPS